MPLLPTLLLGLTAFGIFWGRIGAVVRARPEREAAWPKPKPAKITHTK
jgi:hypothetical protein